LSQGRFQPAEAQGTELRKEGEKFGLGDGVVAMECTRKAGRKKLRDGVCVETTPGISEGQWNPRATRTRAIFGNNGHVPQLLNLAHELRNLGKLGILFPTPLTRLVIDST
jgi:hypothetical protein